MEPASPQPNPMPPERRRGERRALRVVDSAPITLRHIHAVQRLLWKVIDELGARSLAHDASKLEEPERSGWDRYSVEMAGHPYGSDEWRTGKERFRWLTEWHVAHNQHHPEHFRSGIRGMSLVDLIEMLCDWCAAGQQYPDNQGLAHSIDFNQKRFGYSDELKAILLNTARLLEEDR